MSKQKIGYIIAGCFLILALIGYGCSRVTITKKQPANSESGATAVTTTVTTVSSAKYDRRNPGGETTTTEQGSTPTEGDVTTTKEVVTTTRKYDRRNPDAAMEQYTTTTTAAATTVSLIESVDMVTVDAEITAVAADDKSSTGYSLTIKLLEGDDKGAFVIYNVDESLISKYKIGQKVRVTYELDEKKVVAVI